MLKNFTFPILHLFQKNKYLPWDLYVKALKSENSGHFENAYASYKSALGEINKSRFQNVDLKKRTMEKLKVLETIINYKNSFYAVR
jgi:hypothetical protein